MKKLNEILTDIGCWVLTALLAWNVYLYSANAATNTDLQGFKLHVAREYISKPDLKDMLDDLEEKIGQRFEDLKTTIRQ